MAARYERYQSQRVPGMQPLARIRSHLGKNVRTTLRGVSTATGQENGEIAQGRRWSLLLRSGVG